MKITQTREKRGALPHGLLTSEEWDIHSEIMGIEGEANEGDNHEIQISDSQHADA